MDDNDIRLPSGRKRRDLVLKTLGQNAVKWLLLKKLNVQRLTGEPTNRGGVVQKRYRQDAEVLAAKLDSRARGC